MGGRDLCADELGALSGPTAAREQSSTCPTRPAVGSVVGEPEDLRSAHGVLRVDLSYRTSVGADGETHFCYVSAAGKEAPTLRVRPGDLLVLRLKNVEPEAAGPNIAAAHQHPAAHGCTSGTMSPTATNVHFHGLTVPPVCHQDDVLNTLIQAGDQPFEYRLRIPANEPPGLYWYHPHVHGVTKTQVLGGASGALIVEGVESTIPALAGLAERVFIIRDRELVNPDAAAGSDRLHAAAHGHARRRGRHPQYRYRRG